jgi:hypothetical protein
MSPDVKFKLLHTNGSEVNPSEPPRELVRYDSWLGCCEDRMMSVGYRLIESRVTD